MQLSEKANKIFKMKYSTSKDETWEQACWRVGSYIASAEEVFGKSQEEIDELSGQYYAMIENLDFIPGGRVLANANTGIKSLMNCFVIDVNDSRISIYNALRDAAEIFAQGGGLGYNLSNIREEGALIKSTNGKASGPLSFATLFDQTGEVISQASRRGAQLLALNIDHPDIEKFIEMKSIPNSRNSRLLDEYHRNLKYVGGTLKNTKYYEVLKKTLLDDQLTHMNVSAVVTDDFMSKISEDTENFDLVSPLGNTIRTIKAKDLFRKLAKRAWESGDPGLIFYDRMNRDNMVPYVGDIRVTNPCGEIGLLPYESCCIGSINLHNFYDKESNSVDYERLEYVVRLSTRFLDDVQEISGNSIDEINKMSSGLRRLGVGIFGWSDLLAELEIPYWSDEAKELAEYLGWFITYFAWLESIEMSVERGPFKFYDPEKVDLSVVLKVLNSKYSPASVPEDVLRRIGLRNVSVTTIAPTGTISILADMNSGIEPYFALAYTRNITEGVGNTAKDTIIEINSILFRKLKEAGLTDEEMEEVKKEVLLKGSVQNIDLVPEKIKNAFSTASEVHWKDHVEMQSAWQKYVSNSISKTINLPNDASVEDIEEAFKFGWESDLKGMTVYRDGSKLFQILNVGAK